MKATWDSNCFSVSNGIYLRLYVYYMIQDIAVKHCDGVHVTHTTVFVETSFWLSKTKRNGI
jgi:hypothetical protein